jgi:hypothetical protein
VVPLRGLACQLTGSADFRLASVSKAFSGAVTFSLVAHDRAK